MCFAKQLHAFTEAHNTYEEGHLPNPVRCYALKRLFGDIGWMSFSMSCGENIGPFLPLKHRKYGRADVYKQGRPNTTKVQ